MTLTNFPDGISTSTITADSIDFPASGTVVATKGTIDTIVATIGTVSGTLTVGLETVTEVDAVTLNVGSSTPITGIFVQSATLTPAAVAPNTSAEQTFAVANLGATDVIIGVNKPTVQAGLMVGGARVTAAGTIGINFGNLTSASITPTSGQVYTIASLKHG